MNRVTGKNEDYVMNRVTGKNEDYVMNRKANGMSLEDKAIAVGDSRSLLLRRLNDAKRVMKREWKEKFGKGSFDFTNKRLVSEDGSMFLQWQIRERPNSPESYNNQQTSIGVVIPKIAKGFMSSVDLDGKNEDYVMNRKANATPKRHLVLHEDKKWSLADQGMPVNVPRDLKTVKSLAERRGWKIDEAFPVWLAEEGKFVPLSRIDKTASKKGNNEKLAMRLVKIAKGFMSSVDLDVDDKQTRFLSDEMASALNDQVAYEMYSAYLYFMVSAWSDSKGLVGFADWFRRQGEDEIGHAMKIFGYLVDTSTDVTLPAIPSPADDISGLEVMEDATRAVLDHEMTVSTRWQKIGELAKSEPNLATQELAAWFMTEQVEEENGAVTLHQKVQLAGDTGAGLLIIDHELKNTDPAE